MGKHLSEEHKSKIRNAQLGRHQSEETIAKRVAKTKGKKRTEETKAKMRQAALARKMQGERNPHWKGDNATIHSGRDRARSLLPCQKGMEHHHIDGNPLNNSPENIMIVTPKQHKVFHQRKRDTLGRFTVEA